MEKKRETAKLFRRSLQKSRFQLCGGVRANSTAFILWAVLACCSAASEPHSEEAKHLRVKKCKYVLPECRCGLYLSNAEVSCRNVSDFEKFAEKLADGSLFEVNATYTIWLSGSSVLPRGFLRGLDVSGLVVDDPPLQGLEEGALEGVLRLQDFMVDKSSIKEVPDFRFIRDSLKLIYMDNSRLTALDGANLRHLPLLEELSFYNNSIEHVAPDAFQGTEGVTYFNISRNRLASLPPDLFEQWSHLKYVDLSQNRLLHVDRLFLPTNPHEIYLDHNNLTDLDSVLHPQMYNLDRLYLSHNPFARVTENSFNGKANSTRYILLDHCLIREFSVRQYIGLPLLVTLDLSYNLIDQVTYQLGHNQKKNFTDDPVRKYTNGRIKRLSMVGNRIPFLTSGVFIELTGLQSLQLQDNRIGHVERNIFRFLRSVLEVLDLSGNEIRSLGGCVRFLSVLTTLNLANNRIEGFEEGEFRGLNRLSHLNLHGNRITTLGGEVHRLVDLEYLTVSSNRIRTLAAEQIPDGLKYLNLTDNPFRCDCEMLVFLNYLDSNGNLVLDAPLCTLPDDTSPPSSCPPGCRCFCTHEARRHFMTVDCSSLGLTRLPTLFGGENFTSAVISSPVRYVIRHGKSDYRTKLMSLVIEDEVAGLDLTNNELASMEGARLPEETRHLLLANNRLRVLPPGLLDSLGELGRVTLSGNPWACDCGTLGFKKWILAKADIVQDVNATKCGLGGTEGAEKAVWSLTDFDLCPDGLVLYVTLAFVVPGFLLLVAGGKIAWTRYQMHVKVWLYSHGVPCVKAKDLDGDREFDAFVSFSHEDQDVVIPELIQQIEARDPGVRLFIHYKHFLPGELIQLNIVRAIQVSKRTVLVLSRSFLDSEWCMFEFRVAHVEALKNRLNRIIIIKMGDLPEDKELPEEIQVYLKSTTYLTWGEKHFWDTLLYTLPRS